MTRVAISQAYKTKETSKSVDVDKVGFRKHSLNSLNYPPSSVAQNERYTSSYESGYHTRNGNTVLHWFAKALFTRHAQKWVILTKPKNHSTVITPRQCFLVVEDEILKFHLWIAHLPAAWLWFPLGNSSLGLLTHRLNHASNMSVGQIWTTPIHYTAHNVCSAVIRYYIPDFTPYNRVH